MPRLVLASGSPQRRAILQQAGIEFEVVVPEAEELSAGPPEEVALENAYRKAGAIGAAPEDALVLGVDTIVVAGGRIYGKPPDADTAGETLRALSGRAHAVISGLCLTGQGRTRTVAARTEVRFRRLAPDQIDWYVASEEWRQRAGGYAIQGRGAALVAEIHGDYLNVVGLPLATLLELEPGLLWPSGGSG